MNLKLSYRDRVIFYVAMVVLVVVAGFFLLIKPKFEDIEIAKANFEIKQQEKADIDAKIQTLPDLIQGMKDSAKEIDEKQKVFLEESEPYVNETYIREALSSLNLDITSMNTTYAEANTIDWYAVEKAHILAYDNKISADLYNELPKEVYDAYNKVEPVPAPNTLVGVTQMVLVFKSNDDLKDAYAVMDRIAEDEKTIILNTIATGDMKEKNEEPEREITVTLTMYSIFPMNVEKVLQETPEVKPIAATAE